MKNWNFAKKITDLRVERDLKQIDVIRTVNERFDRKITAGSYSKWESGREEPSRIQDVAALAQFYGVALDWLIGISDDKFNEGLHSAERFRRVPVLGTIAAGVPICAQEDIIGYEVVSDEQQVDFCLKVKGDSMEGACIFDGDTVFIRQQPEVETGEIAVVIIDGGATLKRFYKINGSVLLRAENPKYKEMVLASKEAKNLVIAGKVVYVKSEVR